MHDDRPANSKSWIYSFNRRTGELTSSHEATDAELRELMADRAVPAATTTDGTEPEPAGREDGGEVIGYTHAHDIPPPHRFEHDPAARVLRLTAPDGSVEAFRDRPAKYLCVEPDPDTGAMRPVVKRGRPVFLYLCREDE
jgi:hypothetical protein